MKVLFHYGIIVLVAVSLGACKTTSEATNETASASTGASAKVEVATLSDAEKKEMEEIYWQRIEEAKMNFTEAEVDFMTGMIGHHAQALVMSDLADKNDASLPVRRLASRIINAQKDEIRSMQTWLEERGQPVPRIHIEGLNLMIHGAGGHEGHDMGGMDHSSMPGMLSQEQLVELSMAKGKEFDEKFLTFMIQHHTGAITMVNDLLNSEKGIQNEGAFKLASEINVDQRTEIERMYLMLAELSSEVNDL